MKKVYDFASGDNMLSPTPIDQLNQLLTAFVDQLKIILQDKFLACYLQGSFAVGDWDDDSDVDFLVVIQNDLSDDDVRQLNKMHLDLFNSFLPWSQHLEGSYFPTDLLKTQDINHMPIWYLDNMSTALERSTHDNELVVRWVTREHGITLYGDNPQTYIDLIDISAMKAEIKKTMHTWGQEILTGEYEIKSLWAQPFVVISYCRMLQSLKTGTIQSKLAGVKWGQANLADKWHDLIQIGWDNRPNPSEKAWQPAPEQAIQDTHDFIRYALQLSETDDF